jgi:hypothetical protein
MRSTIIPLLAAALVAACGPRTMPEAPRPAPAESAGRSASNEGPVCVVRDGALEMIPVRIDPVRGDTVTVDGRRLSDVSPASGYAAGADWYQRNEVIVFRGDRFLKYGIPRQLTPADVVRIGEYRGVPVFTEAGLAGKLDFIYIPDEPGCSFQLYTVAHPDRIPGPVPRPAPGA